MINTKLTVGELVGVVVGRCIMVGRCVGLSVLDHQVGSIVGKTVLMFLGYIPQE